MTDIDNLIERLRTSATTRWSPTSLIEEAADALDAYRKQTGGAQMIAAERQRQLATEGWTSEHDDEHNGGELVHAAIAYAEHAHAQDGEYLDDFVANTYCDGCPAKWPWHESWWKPADDPIRNLVKAGALIAAEIDRLDRAATFEEPT